MNANHPLDLSMDGFGGVPRQPRVPYSAPGATLESNPQQQDTRAAQPNRAPRKKPTPSQRPATPKKKPDSKPTFNAWIEFFRSQRTRLALGIILSVMCLFWLMVSISYLKNGPVDQSIVAENSVEAIANAPEGVQNAGGAAGAKLAHVLMVDGLGVGSFVLVVYSAVLALALFGLVRCKFWAFTFKCLFTAISLSIITGLFTYNAETAFHWGGNHGRYVNQWLFHVSDALGAYAISVILIGLLAVMYLAQLRSFYINVSGKVTKARAAMAEAAAKGRQTPTDLADIPGETPTVATPTEVNDADPKKSPLNPAPTPQPVPPIAGFSIDDIEDEFVPATIQSVPAASVPDPVAPQPTSSEPEFSIKSATIGEPADTAGLPADIPTEQEEAPMQPYSIRDELSHYAFPAPDLLIDRPNTNIIDPVEQEENKNMIVSTLQQYNIEISRIEATIGPTVTLYEIVPAPGVRIQQIKRLEDDIARSLEALGIRIIAPIPGKNTVGIEVPNRKPQTVSMFSVINSAKFRDCKMQLPMALGATINNDIFIEDLAKMPHLLVAGATGQGKSVGLNCIIASLLYKKHPGELKFVLIDPKMVEFSLYSRLENHYLAKLPDEEDPIVTDPNKALVTLASLCEEMDNRYELLKSASVRNLEEYNRKFSERRLNPEKGHRYMPYIVVVVDEFADLIMTAGKDISMYIARIAQKARAVGMHMILATQRPSTDIITGMIKANFPGRIAFRVAQMVDSKTILDRPGANRLIGRGDMLFSHNSKIERVQCAFIDTPEVEALVDHIDNQIGYSSAYLLPEPQNEGGGVDPGSIDLSKRDDMFDVCARFVVQNPTASTSSLQRRFSIGYNKAGKIMDQMEAAGIVGPADGQRPRTVLVDHIQLEDILRSL